MTERPFPSITRVSRESLQISSPLMINAVSVKCTSPHTLPYTALVPEITPPDIGVVLRAGMGAQGRVLGNIGVSAGDGLSKQGRALVHIGIVTRNGVVEDPGVISHLKGQVALALYKAAQLPGLYLLPDIPQGPDAVEKGIFLMGDIGQFVFLIDYCFISFLQTGEGPPLGTAPPVCFCLRF